MRNHFDLPYKENASEMQKLDLYLPDSDNFETILWFHGGGIETGSRKDDAYARPFVERGYGFVSAEYRMYPEARFPQFIEDAAEAAAWVVNHIGAYGGNEKVYVSGESAGAYFTMLLCMDQHYLEKAGIHQEQIAAYISDSAQQCAHYNVLREAGEDPRLERIDQRAPIYFIREGLTIRPLLLMYYSDDIVCRPEENRLLYTNIKKVMPEAFVDITELPGQHCSRPKDEKGSYVLVERVCEFLKKVNCNQNP